MTTAELARFILSNSPFCILHIRVHARACVNANVLLLAEDYTCDPWHRDDVLL